MGFFKKNKGKALALATGGASAILGGLFGKKHHKKHGHHPFDPRLLRHLHEERKKAAK